MVTGWLTDLYFKVTLDLPDGKQQIIGMGTIMKTIRKTYLMLFFAAWIVLAYLMLFHTAIPVHAEDTGETVMTNVRYIDRSSGDNETKYCPEAIAMSTVSGNTIGNGKWYIVDKTITRNSRLQITGECNLILSSHGKLECSKGISVNRGNTLNIYSADNHDSGWLKCELSSEDGYAAIGGDEGKNGGIINIHGGSINAEARCYGAGIGGGKEGHSGFITIYGGIINATGGLNAAGIGGGLEGAAENIDIWGGNITATARGTYWTHNMELTGHAAAIGSGSDRNQGGGIGIFGGIVKAESVNGAGIGSSEGKNAGEIVISGGEVTASRVNGAGIGGGRYGNGGETIITGGTVTAMSLDQGAGIGGGQKGSGGYVYIDDGKVIATGGKLNVKFFDALNYENYGQSWGRENVDWNIVASLLFALFKSGEFGGAGIGGGHSGSGAEVVILGGEVIANAGCPSAHAIGGGIAKQGGSLRLYDKACVMAASDTSDVNSLALVLSEQRISSARTNPYVHIFPCIHPDGYSYSYTDKDGNIDKEYHTFSCKYCAGENSAKERHDFDENGKCVCNYSVYNVSLFPNNGLGEKVSSLFVSKGEDYTVPECPFTAPEGKIFSHWLVKYMSHEYPDREAVKGDTLQSPENGRIILLAQWVKPYDVWVGGIRVTEKNRNNILGDDGSAVYTPGEGNDGTLTLNSPGRLAENYGNALIYAENTNLTIDGTAVIRSANNAPENGIRVKNGTLTILAKDLEVYGNRTGITVESGNLQIAGGAQRVFAQGSNAAILAPRDGIQIDRSLGIVMPENGIIGNTRVDGKDLFTIRKEMTSVPAFQAEIKASSYTVTWKPGYEGGEPVQEETTAWNEIVMPSTYDGGIGFWHPNGDVFSFWEEDATGAVFAPGDSYTVKDNVSFTAQWVSAFPIWVNGVQVTAENTTDVLKDKSVIYDPDTATLKLNSPTKMNALHNSCWIYAEGVDLTIEGSADIVVNNLSGSRGIWVDRGSLTLRTDSLSVNSSSYAIQVSDEDMRICSGTVTVKDTSSVGIFIERGSLNIEDDDEGGKTVTRVEVECGRSITDSSAFALRCFQGSIHIGDTLEITEPEKGVVGDGSNNGSCASYMDEKKHDRARHIIITRRPDDPDDPDDPPVSYRVIYSVSGDIPRDCLEPDPQDFEAGTEAIVADSPVTTENERNGVPGTYSFDGWHAPEGVAVENNHFLMPESDVVFTGRWTFTPAQFTVSFVDEDGTTLLSPAQYKYGTPADNIRKPQDPYKKSDEQYRYTFAGWEPPLTDVTEDVTYRASYTASERSADDEELTVSFDSAGGTEVPSQSVRKWSTAAKPENPTRDGYLFGTWTLDGSAYDFNTPVTENITLTAWWEPAGEPVDPPGDDDYQITDEVEDHVYDIYQIFTGDYTEMENAEGEGTHPNLTNVVWGENGMFPDGVSKGDPVSQEILQALDAVANVELDKTKLAEIEKYIDFSSYPIRTLVAEDTEPVSASLPSGYYLIRDRNGTQTGEYDAYTTYITVIVKDYTIAPKSVKPSVDKQVSDNEPHYEATSPENPTNINPGVDGFYESADHAIHESFRFKLTAMLPASERYTDYSQYMLTFCDTMSSGVTFEDIESVTMAGKDLHYYCDGVLPGEAGKEWTLTVVLPKAEDGTYRNLSGGASVEVIYRAHLNENAIAHNASTENTDTNSNSVYLEYSNNPNKDINPTIEYEHNMGRTATDIVWVFTYEIESVKKADSEEGPPLPGAGFTLFNGQTAVKLTDRGNGSYIVADQRAEQDVVTEMVSNNDGVFHLSGLDTGTYTLRETSVPGGYNGCEDTVVTITASHAENNSMTGADLNLGNTRLKYKIVNQSGAILPSTGGPGTKPFCLAGILLTLGAGILLITHLFLFRV